MSTPLETEVLGRLGALEEIVATSLAFGWKDLPNRADLMQELRQQLHARADKLPSEAQKPFMACIDRLLYAALAAADPKP